MSHEGIPIKELSSLFKKDRKAIALWFDKWESEGLKGLEIKPGRGLKAALSVSDEETVELVKKN